MSLSTSRSLGHVRHTILLLSIFLSINLVLFAPTADALPVVGPSRNGMRLLQRRKLWSENPAWTALIKRSKYPVPTQAECDAAMADPGVPCMFYTSYTQEAAAEYATANGYALIDDPRADVKGWAQYEDGTPAYLGQFAAPIGEDWTADQGQEFWNCMSAAFGKVCSGIVYVGVPPNYEIAPNSVFNVYELPPIRANFAAGTVTELIAIPFNQNSADGTPTGPTKTLLPCPPPAPPAAAFRW